MVTPVVVALDNSEVPCLFTIAMCPWIPHLSYSIDALNVHRHTAALFDYCDGIVMVNVGEIMTVHLKKKSET